MENQFVSSSTLIGEIVKNYPAALTVLSACGMHCVGCPVSQRETLEEACRVHDLETDLVVKAINDEIAREM